MVYTNLLTILTGRKTWINFKDVLKVFRTSYTQDIVVEQNCVVLMAGFETDNGIEVEGCLEVF